LTTRPFVWANCAVSTDGRLAYAHGRRAHLSGPEDLRRVQRLRVESQAILVGAGTVRADDPSLRVHWEMLDRPPGPSPMRIILASDGAVPEDARVLDGSIPTLVATTSDCQRNFPNGVERFSAGRERVDLAALLDELGRRGIRQLLVEGGSQVLASFFRGGHVDRFTVFVAPVLIGGTSAPTLMGGPETPDERGTIRLRGVDVVSLDNGWLATYEPEPGSSVPQGPAPSL
jgi:riboflavin-specific deaminase-like protein